MPPLESMNQSKPVFRFAPSPNGYLHLGHALSALVTADMARRMDGRLLVRIEDIDTSRCRPEFEAQILDDLAWLGLSWEEPVRRQSEHMASYREGVDALQALGVLYPCFATRKEIVEAVASAPHSPYPTDPDGAPIYPGLHKELTSDETARRRGAGEEFALRLDMEKALRLAAERQSGPLTFQAMDEEGRIAPIATDPARWGDVVIARKDAPTSYHLSVVMDDALQGVTHVTRGLDLLAATDLHRLLQLLLGLSEPIYHHHRLVVDEEGRKLSKRDKDKSLLSLRREGASVADVCRLAGFDFREK